MPTNRIKDIRRRHEFYILGENHQLIPVDDLIEWAQFLENGRRVAQTSLNGLWVSTVFLGLDHAWSGPPKLFETMIFRDVDHAPPSEYFEKISEYCRDYQMRYSTWDEAVKGHEDILTIIREGLF
jgi:hypothetical protein